VINNEGNLVAIAVKEVSKTPKSQKEDTSWGMFKDDPEMMDSIVEQAMKDREKQNARDMQ
jgi:hypothetical protein